MLTLTNVTWLDILLCLACAGVYFLMWVFNRKNPAPYPPGPPGWPLIGNILNAPHIRVRPWLTFTTWGKKYGNISHIEVMGQHIVALNSVKTAMDTLDKKVALYSELVGWKHSLALLPDGVRFCWSRRNLHCVIGSRAAVGIYSRIEEVETCRFLKRVLTKPGQLQAHIRHTTGAIILRISYLVKAPERFPGAGFKRLVREWRETLEDMVFTPYNFVKDQMAAGIAPESFTSNLLENRTLSVEDNNVLKWSAASLYAGGADTTVSCPEIDAVIGPDRLPSFADRGSLPYTEVLAKEVLRWNVVAPTGLPHRVTEDDIHDGYFIPKCSLVIPNIWLNKLETDHRTICFGFGRRICPGILNSQKAPINILMLLVFDI
ncbi:cytochrome P450 [Suillus plorans]|uniref:Cytochrome P450 n=1 Tax=Suillus plorans TaxID=116603 RepID=A0A9P7AK91_9AGAM|nr:cytochrome P450 [Suillus plorans]KAG1791189.1 cytochrome P450 [Suillus plorans]